MCVCVCRGGGGGGGGQDIASVIKMLQIHRLENSGAMETQRVPSGPLSLPRDGG